MKDALGTRYARLHKLIFEQANLRDDAARDGLHVIGGVHGLDNELLDYAVEQMGGFVLDGEHYRVGRVPLGDGTDTLLFADS